MIFISYSGKNIEINLLIEDIESLGKEVWYDKKLSGGQEWWDTILNNILKADVFVFVVTEKSVQSAACKSEYTYALDLGKPLLPIIIDENNTHLPPLLSKLHFVSYYERNTHTALELAKAIYNLYDKYKNYKLPDSLPKPPSIPIAHIDRLKNIVSSSKNLDYNEQYTLLLDIQEYFKHSDDYTQVKSLLEKFQERKDLLAVIDKEIVSFFDKNKDVLNEKVDNLYGFEERKPYISTHKHILDELILDYSDSNSFKYKFKKWYKKTLNTMVYISGLLIALIILIFIFSDRNSSSENEQEILISDANQSKAELDLIELEMLSSILEDELNESNKTKLTVE